MDHGMAIYLTSRGFSIGESSGAVDDTYDFARPKPSMCCQDMFNFGEDASGTDKTSRYHHACQICQAPDEIAGHPVPL